jgi:RHS repeat-associated protein
MNFLCRYTLIAATLLLGLPLSATLVSASKSPFISNHGINFSTGNKYLHQIDISTVGPVASLSFTRYYNSQSKEGSILGFGWSFSLNDNLTFEPGHGLAIYKRADGKVIHFTYDGINSWINEVGKKSVIAAKEDGNGHLLTLSNGSTMLFNTDGRLTEKIDRNNNGVFLAYEGENLKSINDDFGRSLTFNYGDDNRLVFVATSAGNYAYSYDENGNLTKVTRPDAKFRTYLYQDTNDLHNLTGVIDEGGQRIQTIGYDQSDRVTSSSLQGGREAVTISYQPGYKRIVTNSDNVPTTYQLEVLHGVAQVKSFIGPGCTSCGSDTGSEYVYDFRQQVTEVTDARGYKTSYTFDDLGNVLTKTSAVGEPEQHTQTYTYDESVNKVKTISELSVSNIGQNKVTSMVYDAAGNTTSRTISGYSGTDSITQSTSYTYDLFGRITAIDGPRTDPSDTISFSYYPNDPAQGLNRGFIHTVTNALGHTTTYSNYNSFGKAETITDASGLTTTLQFDGNDRVVSRTNGSHTTNYVYDDSGKLLSQSLPGGRTVTYSYNSAGNVEKIINSLGNSISYTYDSESRKTKQSINDPAGTLTAFIDYAYDQNGNLHKIINPDESEREFNYDEIGNLASKINELTKTTEYIYDPLNRLTSIIETGSYTSTFEYDHHGNQATVSGAEGNSTSFTYDDFGNRLTRTSPDSGTTTYTYDITGNLLTKTDANNVTVSYSYDALNRLLSVTYPDIDLNTAYTYDEGENAKGRLTSVEDGVSVTTYSYDAYGNLVGEEKVIGGGLFAISYGFNNNDELTSISYPSGRQVTYNRDAIGRVISVSSSSNGESVTVADSIESPPFGPTSSLSLGNGLIVASSYDKMYRLSSTSVGEIYNRSYSYLATGQVESTTDQIVVNNSQQFGYDDVGRLATASGSYGPIDFTYDAVGNRLTKTSGDSTETYTYQDATNRLAAIITPEEISFSYDDAGNILSKGEQQFNWNQDNRLTSVTVNTEIAGEYGYDAQGLRVIKTVGDTTTLSIYDVSANLLSETTEQGETIREYVYLDGQRLTLFDYTVQPQFSLEVASSTGVAISSVKSYAFDETGRYAGIYGETDEDGEALYERESFGEGSYTFRIDYLGGQYWSDPVAVQTSNSTSVVIEEEEVLVQVVMDDQAQEGANVYVFDENGNYLGIYGVTDAEGNVSFTLPQDEQFTFRADLLGGQYWSSVATVYDGGTSVSVDAGGGELRFFVGKDSEIPMLGIKTYLFSESGNYLGQTQTTDVNGEVTYTVPEGNFSIRVDYLGYKFWSEPIVLVDDTGSELQIPHRTVNIDVVASYQEEDSVLADIKCYLFTPSGAYQGLNVQTDETGNASIDLPEKPYRFRVDYLGGQYWSEDLTWQDSTVRIEHGKAVVEVTQMGTPVIDVPVYVFNESGVYLGMTGKTGEGSELAFTLPAGTYRFRADYQHSQYWGDDLSLTVNETNPVQVSTGGGSFTLKLTKQQDLPLENVRVYAFSATGSYLGEYANTSDQGEVSFNLADGNYTFRIDYLGYQYWSDTFSIPELSEAQLVIEHSPVSITALTRYNDQDTLLEGVKAYLFTPSDTYLGITGTTDTDGKITFELPAEEYKVRVDYFGDRYWLETINQEDTQIIIPEGLAHVILQSGEELLPDIPVYVFSESDAYLGLTAKTEDDGIVVFALPEGNYKFRADYQSSHYWASSSLVADTSRDIILQTGGGTLSFTIRKGDAGILSDVSCYLFNESGNYLGLETKSDENGLISFDVADGSYKIRVDYLGYQYWSEVVTAPEVLSATVQIPHSEVAITTFKTEIESSGPLPGIRCYLFTEAGVYTGINTDTDEQGVAHFTVPDNGYKVRADYFGQKYWSETFNSTDTDIAIAHGDVVLTVYENSSVVSDTKVYLFNDSGSYLGMNNTTDESGIARFTIPIASYQLRVDSGGSQYWTNVINVLGHQDNSLEISIDELTLNPTNNPSPKRFDGQPPLYMPLLASTELVPGMLAESSATLVLTDAARAFWFVFDHLGTAQVITDEDGDVIWQGDYSPFGEVTVAVDCLQNNFRFPGQYYDTETGLQYNHHRYYDPSTGRYISADPIGLAGGINLYAYVGNDPVNFIDPWGLLVLIGGGGGGGGHTDGVLPPKGLETPNYVTVTSGLYFGSSNKGGSQFGAIQASESGGVWGATGGYGADFTAYFGDAEDMCADGLGGTLHLGVGDITLSKDDNGNWSVGLSLGKGAGLGVTFHENKSHITPIWDSKYGK